MSAISATKEILNVLNGNEVFFTKYGEKIFPLIAENSTTFPFIVVERNGINPIYSKQHTYHDNVAITINVVSKSYAESVEIAEDVRNILNDKKNHFFSLIRLTNVTENYADDAYTQTLSFDAIIK